MTKEIDDTAARQGDRRRTTRTALTIGTLLAFIVLGVIVLFWA